MKSLNKVQIIGHLGDDPELRFTANGSKLVKLRVATNSNWKDRDGNQQTSTEWHSIEAWGDLAELINNLTRKGSLIYIEGRLATDSWQDRNTGERRYMTKIKANDFILLAGRDRDDEPEQDDEPESEPAPAPQRQPQRNASATRARSDVETGAVNPRSNRRSSSQRQQPQRNAPMPLDDNDDIPF